MPGSVRDNTAKTTPRRQLAEFVAIWSFAAAAVLCPWVSAAAFSGEGRFEPFTTTLLWVLSLTAFLIGCAALFVHVPARVERGESPRRIWRELGLHAGLTVAVLAVGLVIADVALAAIRPLPAAARLDVPNAQIYGWAFAPHQSIAIVNPDTGQLWREKTNNRGWRDVEHLVKKSRPRVLLLGDSHVFGVGVPLPETLGRQLQQQLDDRCEVITVGISGWGTDQEYLFLEYEGWSYRPDVVILAFTMTNDVMNNMYDRAFFGTARKPWFRLEDDRLALQPLPQSRPSFLRRLFGRSAICRRVRLWQQTRGMDREALGVRFARVTGESPALPTDGLFPEDMENDYSHMAVFNTSWSRRLKEGWRLTLRLLEEIDRGCRANGARLLLYPLCQPPADTPSFPWTHRGATYQLDLARPFRLLRQFCRERDIAHLNEPDAFRVDYHAGRLRFRTESHLNAEGYRRAAQNIARWVGPDGLLHKPGEGTGKLGLDMSRPVSVE